jgi:hypothetical protein
MRKYVTVEEAHIKLGITCKICNQKVAEIPDFDKPLAYFKQETQSDGIRCFTIGWHSKPHPFGLCYYHLKQKLGYFDTITANKINTSSAKEVETFKQALTARMIERRLYVRPESESGKE